MSVCQGYDRDALYPQERIYGELVRGFRHLKHVALFRFYNSADDDDRHHSFDHLQRLLRRFFRPQYLSIISEEDERYAVFELHCLKTHLASLRHLRLLGGKYEAMLRNISECEPLVPPLSKMQALAGEAHRLCQIALGFPGLSMRDFECGNMGGCNNFIVRQICKVHMFATLTSKLG